MKDKLTVDNSVRLVQLAADYLRAEAKNETFKPLFELTPENQDLFGNILQLSQLYLRARRDPNVRDRICQQLQSVKFSESCIQQAVTILESLKQELQDAPSISYLPVLQGFRWRVDITISSSVLSRVLEPTIIMDIKLDTNKTVTFQVSISKFHKLRYSVATMLRRIEAVENAVSSVPV